MPTAAALVGGSVVSGLIGAEGAKSAAETQARGASKAARIAAEASREAGGIQSAAFREAAGGFQPFTVGGAEAAQQEAALSGALGPEAQQAALSAQVESPFTKFLEQRGRAQIGQGFAAQGGLGGGQRLEALNKFGQGVASQSLSTQLQNLRNVRQAGSAASFNIADFIARAGGAEARGIRGEGIAQSGGAANVAAARAQGQLGVSQAVGGLVGDVSVIGALQSQGKFDRPPPPPTFPNVTTGQTGNTVLINPI